MVQYEFDTYCEYVADKPITTITLPIKSNKIRLLIQNYRDNKGINITFGDVVIYSICQCLPRFREFNSNFTTNLSLYNNFDIGYVINLGKESMAAILFNAEKKSITEIAHEVKRLCLAYLRDEMIESNKPISTFIVTNLSSFSTYQISSPLYKFQSAVLIICSEYSSIDHMNDKLIHVKRFNLILSYDSRVADCQRGHEFMRSIKDILEEIS